MASRRCRAPSLVASTGSGTRGLLAGTPTVTGLTETPPAEPASVIVCACGSAVHLGGAPADLRFPTVGWRTPTDAPTRPREGVREGPEPAEIDHPRSSRCLRGPYLDGLPAPGPEGKQPAHPSRPSHERSIPRTAPLPRCVLFEPHGTPRPARRPPMPRPTARESMHQDTMPSTTSRRCCARCGCAAGPIPGMRRRARRSGSHSRTSQRARSRGSGSC